MGAFGALGTNSMFGANATSGADSPGGMPSCALGASGLGFGAYVSTQTPFGYAGATDKHMQNILKARTVAASADPSSRRWWVLAGGRPSNLGRNALQGYICGMRLI